MSLFGDQCSGAWSIGVFRQSFPGDDGLRGRGVSRSTETVLVAVHFPVFALIQHSIIAPMIGHGWPTRIPVAWILLGVRPRTAERASTVATPCNNPGPRGVCIQRTRIDRIFMGYLHGKLGRLLCYCRVFFGTSTCSIDSTD